MFVFEDRFCVELTADQQAFFDNHGVGMDRFHEANDNDVEVFPPKSFGDLVTWLVSETDLFLPID